MTTMMVKPKVLDSLQNAEGNRCVDIFIRADGTYGFEEYRRDPEDGGGWYALARYSAHVFDTEAHATAQARKSVTWLALHEPIKPS